jgi:crotonobetainyl-CoA:carnitine CoA-transferase CaiB-like acyl-CoA transferase
MTDPRVRGRQMSVTQVSPEAGEVTMPGIAIKMSATPPRLGAAARQPGADAREVLELAGLTGPRQSLSELEELWAVQATGLPAGWETMSGPQGTAKHPQGTAKEV